MLGQEKTGEKTRKSDVRRTGQETVIEGKYRPFYGGNKGITPGEGYQLHPHQGTGNKQGQDGKEGGEGGGSANSWKRFCFQEKQKPKGGVGTRGGGT